MAGTSQRNGRHLGPHAPLCTAVLALLALFSLLALGACGRSSPPDPAAGSGPSTPPPGVEVPLFFADRQAQHLWPEWHRLREAGPEAKVEALLDGPEGPGLVRTLPESRLLGVRREEGTLWLDFDAAFAERFPRGSAVERLLWRSLAINLTGEGIEAIRITVEGREVPLGERGEPLRLTRGPIETAPVLPDPERLADLQRRAESGEEAWRFDPAEVVRREAPGFGFWPGETGREVERATSGEGSQGGVAWFRVEHEGEGGGVYGIRLVQPVRGGRAGIWTIAEVRAEQPEGAGG